MGERLDYLEDRVETLEDEIQDLQASIRVLNKQLDSVKSEVDGVRVDVGKCFTVINDYVQKIVNSLVEFYPPIGSILKFHFYKDDSGFNYRGIVPNKGEKDERG